MKAKLIAAITVGTAALLGLTLAAESLASLVHTVEPQRGWRRRGGGLGGMTRAGSPGELSIQNQPQEGKFTFLRLRFDEGTWGYSGRYMFGLDMGWNHDYPRAEHNLSMMLDTLTEMPVTVDPRGGNILSFSEPEIFQYPFVYISEPGYWYITPEEAVNLRTYLKKGGFLMVDDMGSDDTYQFLENLRQALPEAEYEILDTTHPIFNCFFQITPEDILRQRFGYGAPVIFGIYDDNDPSKRLLAVVNHNQDIGESWEYSNVGYVPIEESNNSYKLGMNYVICSMLH